jgi:hypothetical protein
MTGAAIDGGALLKMLYSSLLGGIGVSVIFSLTVLGAIRSTDMRRSGRGGVAVAYAALATVGLLLTTAIVVYGLILVGRKG